MATALRQRKDSSKTPVEKIKRLHLKTWSEAQAYFKKHLTPIRHGPKGQPLYALEDIEALNVILPEEYW